MTATKLLFRRLPMLFVSLGLLLLLFALTTVKANAVEVETEDGFTVDRSRSYNGYTVSLTGYTGSSSDVTLPATATIGGTEYTITTLAGAFKENTAITSVAIPEGYTNIEASALSGCAGLKSVSLPASMTSIGSNAFENCTSLTHVTFASGGTDTLGVMNAAFANCTSLQSIEFPANLSGFANDANVLYGCTALTAVTVAEGNETFFSVDGLLYEKTGDATATLVSYPFGKTDAVLSIPETVENGSTTYSVTALGAHLFRKNATLKEVTVPASVTEFKLFCFDGCSGLTKLKLNCETAPTLGTYAFTGLPSGSVIEVANDAVAAALEPKDYYTYYTSGNTTVKVASTPAKEVSAALSLEAASALTEDGKVQFDLYLDSASYVSTLTLKLTFDARQVSEGTLTVAESQFDTGHPVWSAEGDTLSVTLMLNQLGNKEGLSCEEKTLIASIALPLNEGVTGRVSATMSDPVVTGITDVDQDAANGTATLTNTSAAYYIASYDVNGDGRVTQLDITEAQRYYQATSTDENWNTEKKADVNGDNVVNLEDLIAIFRTILAV